MDQANVVSTSALPVIEESASRNIVSACFSKKGEFVTRSIAGETILVPVRGQIGDLDAIYNLNEVGTFIWERLNGTTNVRQIADVLATEFEVTLEDAEIDTLSFTKSLEAAGIIELIGIAEV